MPGQNKSFIEKYFNSTIKWIDRTIISKALSISLSKVFSDFWISHPLLKIALDKVTGKVISSKVSMVDSYYTLKEISFNSYFETPDIVKTDDYIPASMRYYSETRYDIKNRFLESEKWFHIDNIDEVRYTDNVVLEESLFSSESHYKISGVNEEKMNNILVTLSGIVLQVAVQNKFEALAERMFGTGEVSRLKKSIATVTIGFVVSDLIKVMDKDQQSLIVNVSKKALDYFYASENHQNEVEQELAGVNDSPLSLDL